MPPFDFLQNLRLSSIFGGPNPTFEGAYNPPEYEPMTPEMGMGGNSIADMMTQMYTPQNQAYDRFSGMIDEFPQRPTDQSGLRKVGAVGLATLADMFGKGGGKDAFSGVMYPGYDRKVAEWKEKIGPAQQAANLERQTNINERTMSYQTAANTLREQAQAAKEKNDAVRAQIAQQRADVYQFRTENPNARIIAPKGGNIRAVHPVTGALIRDFGPAGTMSDADRIALEQTNAMARIGATGDEARETARVRGEEARATAITPRPARPSAASTRPELPTQTRVRQFNAARELSNTRQDLAKFIKVGDPGSSDFTITPPGKNIWGYPTGPTEQQYKEINDAIYGAKTESLNIPIEQAQAQFRPTNVPPPTQQPIRKQQVNKATGQTRTLISTDGGKTWRVENASPTATR